MDPIKVDEILKTIREDHDLVAEQLCLLEELERITVGPGDRQVERALALLRAASHFFQTKLLSHLDEEERGMFLLFRERLPKGSTLIYELQSEHEQMRKLCERLREELSWLRHAKHRKPPVLRDVQALCTQITRLLSQHAEREERLLHQYPELTHEFEVT
jgi:hemerythrin-like domain-containing protein